MLFFITAVLLGWQQASSYLPDKQLEALRTIAKDNQWIEYSDNPVVKGTPGQFDAGALGNMSVFVVDDVVHMYYETWEERHCWHCTKNGSRRYVRNEKTDHGFIRTGRR